MTSSFLEEFKSKFEEIKKMGWYDTNEYNVRRKDDGFIGQIFERLMGVKENNSIEADFGDIEIKTHRREGNSLITLFTSSPAYPKRANTFLRNNFGRIDPVFNDYRINMTMSATRYVNTDLYKYTMKPVVDRKNRKIYIKVKEIESGEIVSYNVYYTFDQLQEKLDNKLRNVAYLEVDTKLDDDGSVLIKFDSLVFLYEPKVETFVDMIESGEVKIDLRLDFYDSEGSRYYGKRHDHGTAFRISKTNINKLFNVLKVE